MEKARFELEPTECTVYSMEAIDFLTPEYMTDFGFGNRRERKRIGLCLWDRSSHLQSLFGSYAQQTVVTKYPVG